MVRAGAVRDRCDALFQRRGKPEMGRQESVCVPKEQSVAGVHLMNRPYGGRWDNRQQQQIGCPLTEHGSACADSSRGRSIWHRPLSDDAPVHQRQPFPLPHLTTPALSLFCHQHKEHRASRSQSAHQRPLFSHSLLTIPSWLRLVGGALRQAARPVDSRCPLWFSDTVDGSDRLLFCAASD